MEIQAISPRGYCYGVVNAINVAKKAREEHPDETIYILGMIVHNKYIVKALENLRIQTLDDVETSREDLLDTICSGIVILSAHGSAQKVKDKAIEKGFIVYDATCKDVTKTHDLIQDYLNQGYDVIYLGKENHPEAIAACSLSERVHLVTNGRELRKLKIKNDKIFITNQTTISILEAQRVFDIAQKTYANIVISQEICNATRIRQEAVLEVDEDVDVVYIVGDPKSNNSNKLASLARTRKLDVYMIETVKDIELLQLHKKKKAAITSGASTPTYLTNQVIEYLKNFNKKDESTYQTPDVDINKILD